MGYYTKKMIDLKKFCRKSHYAEILTEPFSDNDYTYASDGCIIIRVDKIPKIIKTGIPGKAAELFEENKINENEIWIDPPKFEIIERNCSKCKGTGKITVCEECEGVGSLEFSNSYNDYDVECKSCFGKNIKNEKCEACEGTGKYKEYSSPVIEASVRVVTDIRINGIYEDFAVMLNGMYLEMIQDLPNIKIALQDNSIKPVKLKFDGGIGLLMPMEHSKSIS